MTPTNTESRHTVVLATRGSALAMAQAHMVMDQCLALFPAWHFEIKVIKTSGDKLQSASLASPDLASTKGLFTKELEQALLSGKATLAVHSLKDLPTDLPQGLHLGAVLPRADVRDALIYRAPGSGSGRGFPPNLRISELPPHATIATSSTRRRAQLLDLRPDLNIQPIRGNVGTRMSKLLEHPELDATILAAAGLARLHFKITGQGVLEATRPMVNARGKVTETPRGIMAAYVESSDMLPCVGQAAIGIESRIDDPVAQELCSRLNHAETFHCISAERAFLQAMGGGCQSPVAGYACLEEGHLRLRVISFRDGPARRAELTGAPQEAIALGQEAARRLTSRQ